MGIVPGYRSFDQSFAALRRNSSASNRNGRAVTWWIGSFNYIASAAVRSAQALHLHFGAYFET
jgi:hypothetical protein